MPFSFFLLVGAGVWVINEAFEIFSAGLVEVVGLSGMLGNLLLGVGIWIFWFDPVAGRLARAGTLLASAGLVFMAFRNGLTALTGARETLLATTSTPFLFAATAIAVGVTLIGTWIMRSGAFPRWIGAIMIGCTILTLVLAAAQQAELLQSAANVVLAVVIAETAVLAMGRRS